MNQNEISNLIGSSTFNRGKSFKSHINPVPKPKLDLNNVNLYLGDSLEHYLDWDSPTVIISDGAYGILGFEGDTSNPTELPNWYEPHIKAWSQKATAQTTLWFWNTEIGWASVHPILEKHGWKYVNSNVWNKGKGHVAGNVNTKTIRRFPVVTEMCVQYVFEPKIDTLPIKDWLRQEWKRSGLPWTRANKACGVKNAATRKYFDTGHLWYFPPPEAFVKLATYANEHGDQVGKPYFSQDGTTVMSASDWQKMRAKFYCPHGYLNVWEREPLHGKERVKAHNNPAKSAHLNQKPLSLMKLIIEVSSDAGDTIWEPFGGLFSASLASKMLGRRAFSCEIDSDYFALGIERFKIDQVLFNF